MRATIEWAEEKYDEMNRLLFNNHLPPCDFSTDLTGAKTLGRFCLTRSGLFVNKNTRRMFVKDYWDNVLINRSNIYELAKPVIRFNNNYDSTEEALLTTLVHEMCHYYTYCDGYSPRQGHGPEFRGIAYTVGMRSNGRFTIQRFATAEEMTQRTLDPKLQARKDRRVQNKKTNTSALFIYLANGEVRLITTTNDYLLDSIINAHKGKEKEKQIVKAIKSNDANLIEFLYSNGYRKTMRTYRY